LLKHPQLHGSCDLALNAVDFRNYDMSVVLRAGKLCAARSPRRSKEREASPAQGVCTGCDGCVWRVTAGHAPRASSAASTESGGVQPTGAVTAGWDGHGAGVQHPASAPAEVQVSCACMLGLFACHIGLAEVLQATKAANGQQFGFLFCGRAASLPHRLAAEVSTSQTRLLQSLVRMLLFLAESRSATADRSLWRQTRRQKDAPRQRLRLVGI